uniref:Uncharacterized protein n=1 Tax=Picea sitchensis TaxID=3332 RepID=A9P0I0_PICSI|nr:unknown [Picea sitchensis]
MYRRMEMPRGWPISWRICRYLIERVLGFLLLTPSLETFI